MYCRRGAGCQGRSCSAWVCRKMMPLAACRAEVLPSGPSIHPTSIVDVAPVRIAVGVADTELCTRMPIDRVSLLVLASSACAFPRTPWGLRCSPGFRCFPAAPGTPCASPVSSFCSSSPRYTPASTPAPLWASIPGSCRPSASPLPAPGPRGTTSVTKPSSKPSRAGTRRPVRIMPIACLIGIDARQPVHAAAAGDQANARLGQREHRVLGGDDDVAGERGFEPAAHRHSRSPPRSAACRDRNDATCRRTRSAHSAGVCRPPAPSGRCRRRTLVRPRR